MNFRKAILTAITIVMAACSVEDEKVRLENPLLDQYLSSKSFTEMQVDRSDLDLKQFRITKTESGRLAISIPIIGKKDDFILAFPNQNGKFASFQVHVDVSKHEESSDAEAFTKKKFSANFQFTQAESNYELKVKNSVLLTEESLNLAKQEPTCEDAREVLECAATHIDNMRTIAWLACMVEVPICLAIESADCLLDGCAILES